MMTKRPHGLSGVLAGLFALALLGGCAAQRAPIDYSAFQRANPASILVMPPINDSPDLKAVPAVWSSATRPLAEAGYYVTPVTLVDETFQQNGVHTSGEAQDIPIAKLREFFGADAALYIKVKQYGTVYQLIASETKVVVEGQIVDLRSGESLWKGSAAASSAERQQSNSGGLAGMLISALVNQIVGTVSDAAYQYAVDADARLVATVLPGPRSPRYGRLPGQK